MCRLAKVLACTALAAALPSCGSQPEEQSEAPASPAASPAAHTEAARAPTTAPPVAFFQCRSCHSVEPGKNGIGPTLYGIVGSKAGEVPNYAFSTALKQSGITWDRATLEQWLSGPTRMVPGTKMIIAVPDPVKRKEIIDYLETLK